MSDDTFTINFKRTFRAPNAKAYEVEVLVAPSRGTSCTRPTSRGRRRCPNRNGCCWDSPSIGVVLCRDATPVRIVAPDPRYFALQKLWLGRQAKTNRAEAQ